MIQRALLRMAVGQVSRAAQKYGQTGGNPLAALKTRFLSRAAPSDTPQEASSMDQEPTSATPLVPKSGRARVSIKPLMDDAAMELYFWLSDELEMASPNLSLHAGVSVQGFLNFGKALPNGLPENLRGAIIDLLIVDEGGLPVAGLLFDVEGVDVDYTDQVATLLEAAELPSLIFDPEEEVEAIWQALRPLIAYEIAA